MVTVFSIRLAVDGDRDSGVAPQNTFKSLSFVYLTKECHRHLGTLKNCRGKKKYTRILPSLKQLLDHMSLRDTHCILSFFFSSLKLETTYRWLWHSLLKLHQGSRFIANFSTYFASFFFFPDRNPPILRYCWANEKYDFHSHDNWAWSSGGITRRIRLPLGVAEATVWGKRTCDRS